MEQRLRQWEPLARQLARRFADCAECEDLEQVARFALWQAVQRFDPTRGCQFYTFAVPTIVGALQRYLRDRRSSIRIPRRYWDLRHHMKRMEDVLAQALEREPSIAELSARTGVSEEEVAGAIGVQDLLYPVSLEEVYEGSEGEATQALAERIGAIDPVFEATEQRIVVRQAVEELPSELRNILEQRYFLGATPQEVARQLGIAQIQVARLERRALARLRLALRETFDWGPEKSGPTLHLSQTRPAVSLPTRSRVGGL